MEYWMDWILFDALLSAIAFAAGYIYRDYQHWNRLHNINKIKELERVKEQLNEVNRQLQDEHGILEVKRLKHEVINGVHYFFIESGGQFVGQGATLEDAAKHWTQQRGAHHLGIFRHAETGSVYVMQDNQCKELNAG